MNLRSGALGDFGHAAGKHAVHADDRFIARLQNIDDRRFDAA